MGDKAFDCDAFLLIGLGKITFSEANSLAHGISRYGSLKYPPTFQNFDYVTPDAPKGGSLRTAVLGSFETLTQTLQGMAPEGLNLTYDTLLVRAADEPFSMYGLVAESVEVSPGNSWILFNLNPNAKFHDGTPITPEDVLFSWEIQKDKGFPRSRTLYSKVEKAEKIGQQGIKFTFKKEDSEELMGPERPLIMGMIPLYYSNMDRFAYWDKFGMPSHRLEIGPNPMAWWNKSSNQIK